MLLDNPVMRQESHRTHPFVGLGHVRIAFCDAELL